MWLFCKRGACFHQLPIYFTSAQKKLPPTNPQIPKALGVFCDEFFFGDILGRIAQGEGSVGGRTHQDAIAVLSLERIFSDGSTQNHPGSKFMLLQDFPRLSSTAFPPLKVKGCFLKF